MNEKMFEKKKNRLTFFNDTTVRGDSRLIKFQKKIPELLLLILKKKKCFNEIKFL